MHHFEDKTIDQFRLEGLIGKGAMGDVWRATHIQKRISVAIKFLKADNNNDPWAVDAFASEIRSAACLTHPNAVMVLDHGVVSSKNSSKATLQHFEEGTPYLVMELIRGKTWKDHAEQISWDKLRPMILQLLDLLAHAHARNVIHRDIKPDNVLIEYGDNDEMTPVLTDFGLAQVVNELDKNSEIIAGTPAYMAPEQLMGQWRDQGPWTDIYSLGCTIWRMVSDAAPFGNGLPFEQLALAHLNNPIPLLRNTIEIPVQLEAWLCRSLSKRSQERYTSAAEARHAFERLSDRMLPVYRLKEENEAVVETTVSWEDFPALPDSIPPKRDTNTAPISISLSGESNLLQIPKTWKRPTPPRKQPHIRGIGLYMFGLRSFPYVGRLKQRDTLWNQLINVSRNGAQAMVIAGPAGSGKSRLAQWLCERSEEVGAAQTFILNHQKDAHQSPKIHEILLQDLRGFGLNAQELTLRLENLFQKEPSLLSRIPKIVSFLQPTDLITDQSLDLSEWEKHGLILRLLLRRHRDKTAISRPKVIILHLDNAHWSVEGLRFCRAVLSSEQVEQIPILFLLTMTPEDLVQQNLERIEMAALRNHRRSQTINLQTINSQEHREIVNNFIALSPQLSETLVRNTDGNPHFAKETIADWIRRGVLDYSKHGFKLKEGEKFTVPHSIEQAWKIRLRAATSEFGRLENIALHFAALLGTHINMEEWEKLVPECDKNQLRWIIDELLLHRLARRWKQANGWSFVHPVIPKVLQHIVAEETDSLKQHLRIATVLKEYRRIDTFERIGQHLVHGGQISEGLSHLIRGARIRKRRCEFGHALQLLDFYEKTMAAHEINRSDRRWGHSWSIRLEIAYEQHNQELCKDLKKQLRTSLVRYYWPYTQSQFLAIEGLELLNAGQLDDAFIIFERGAQLAVNARDTQLEIRHLRGLALIEIRQGKLEKATSSLVSLQQKAKQANDRYNWGMCAMYHATIDLQKGDLEQAEQKLKMVINHFSRHKLMRYAAEGINMLGDVYRYQGAFDKAEKNYQKAAHKMEEINHPESMIPRINLAMMGIEKQRYNEALQIVEECIPQLLNNRKYTVVLVSRFVALYALTALKRWGDWRAMYRAIQNDYENLNYIDADIAKICSKAAKLAVNEHHYDEAYILYTFASDQWRALDNQDELNLITEEKEQIAPLLTAGSIA